jgi:hypothetical protein
MLIIVPSPLINVLPLPSTNLITLKIINMMLIGFISEKMNTEGAAMPEKHRIMTGSSGKIKQQWP